MFLRILLILLAIYITGLLLFISYTSFKKYLVTAPLKQAQKISIQDKKIASSYKQQHKEPARTVDETCLDIAIEPVTGVYRIDPIDKNIKDYYYDGKLTQISYSSVTTGNIICDYVNLTLNKINQKNNFSYSLLLPRNLASATIKNTYPDYYQLYVNKEIKLKIRYNYGLATKEKYTIIQWDPQTTYAN